MNINIKDRVTAKLFVGCIITSEVRMHLNQSVGWKTALIIPNGDFHDLKEVHFQDKDYIGVFSPATNITLKELKEFEKIVSDKLLEYCPELSVNSVKFCVFPQVFVK